MSILALYNIKGGVGKTATSVNLAFLAAQEGAKTLLCDLDPQGSASFYFRTRAAKKFNSKRLIKGGNKIEKGIRGTDFDNLDILPADFSYRNLDIILDNLKNPKKRLTQILNPFRQEYKYIFLDCPPNITLLSENIFRAAQVLLIPIIPTTLSVVTFEKLLKFFIDKNLDQLKLYPFFSMVEKRKILHRKFMEDLSTQNPHILSNFIPYMSDIEKMGLYREPVAVFKSNSRAAGSYLRLWREVKERAL